MIAVLLIVLILLNGLFALTEVAVIASRKARLKRLAERGDALARTALGVAEHPTRSLSTIQIGITSIGILNGIVGEATFARPLGEWAAGLGVPPNLSHVVATAIVVIVVTYLSIVFGELVPKRIGQLNPEPLLRLLATPLTGLAAISGPFVRLLSGSTDLVLRVLGAHQPSAPSVTEEEIHLMLAEGSEAGVIEDDERRMVQNLFGLDDRTLASLMLPRSDIVALDIEASSDENLKIVQGSEHARYPVYRESLEQVIGVVTTRKLLLRLHSTGSLDLDAVMEPPVFVPDTLNAMSMLEQFRTSGGQMAFIVDEYGAVQGLVTVHDLLEAITGEFRSPASDESWVVHRPDGSWLLDGALPISDLKRILDWTSLPEEAHGSYQTLGGLLLVLMGRIPSVAESTEWEDWRLEVVDMDGKRIDKVLASRAPASRPSEDRPAAYAPERC